MSFSPAQVERPPLARFRTERGYRSLEILSHDPVQRSTVRIDAPWPGAAGAMDGGPLWLQTLRELFAAEDPVETERRIDAYEEFGGATLFGLAWRYDRACILLGDTGSSKSTVATVIADLFPRAELTAIDPRHFGLRFQAKPLSTASLNYVGDIGTIKKIVNGRDLVHCDVKNGDPIDFYSRCSHLWGANSLPPIADDGGAMKRRVLVLRADRAGRRANVDRNRDAGLAAERAAIAARLLCAFQRLQERGDYLLPECHHEEVGAWSRASNHVEDFVCSACELCDPAEGSALTEIYRAYYTWAATQHDDRCRPNSSSPSS